MKKNKDDVFIDYANMITNSWTFNKMTKQEQNRIIDLICNNLRTRQEVKGTYKQRWQTLNLVYTAFLAGLDYKPIGWREEQ